MAMARFGSSFRALLAARQLSIRACARQFGCSHPFLSRVLDGRRRPPIDELPRWLDGLEIRDPEQRDRLLLLAALEHCPPRIVEHIRLLEGRLDGMRRVADADASYDPGRPPARKDDRRITDRPESEAPPASG